MEITRSEPGNSCLDESHSHRNEGAGDLKKTGIANS